MNEKYNLGEIPFYYSPCKTSSNEHGLPNRLPFSLENRNGVLAQSDNETVVEALSQAYLIGSSISGLMDDSGPGQLYAEDFLQYIDSVTEELNGKKVLEIGCGTGYLLSRLREFGANCVGVEPGSNAIYGMEKYRVSIINDFFSKDLFDEKFDYIIFYCVLEHMQNTSQFLEEVKSLLNDTGRIIVAVPDCEPYIQWGDASMLLHEHWNYFTTLSLRNLLNSKGLRADISKSSYGGCIYACAYMADYLQCAESITDEVSNYVTLVKRQNDKIKELLERQYKIGHSVGIYVPGRLVNALSLMDLDSSVLETIRFFDDNKMLYKTYYPGFKIAIENFTDFLDNPTDTILIATFSFAKVIEEKIKSCNDKCEVIRIEELLNKV